MSRRAERVGGLIKEEVSMMLLREIKDPRIEWVTLTDVRMSNDLKQARLYFTVMGGERERDRSLEGLNSAAPFLSRHLGDRLHLRYRPKLIFLFDEVGENARRIEALLEKVRKTASSGEEED